MIVNANAQFIPLADNSVQCCVTSPPYWGLRKYSGEQELEWLDGWRGGFGLEPTIEMYVAHTVEILREVRRVLRDDGVCFWNLGDSYAHGKPGGGSVFDKGRNDGRQSYEGDKIRGREQVATLSPGLKPKDLCLIPFRVALAAQADGWWVRSVIIWSKPNPMPESVRDRPTDAFEYILMLTKSARYFWDAEAVKEKLSVPAHSPGNTSSNIAGACRNERHEDLTRTWSTNGGRNLRNVWEFATQPYSGAHFATFPEELPRRCIRAATSEKGACIQCGTPWVRVVEKNVRFESGSGKAGNPPAGKWIDDPQAKSGDYDIRMGPVVDTQTIGWRSGCTCRGQHGKTRPCLVLDPFGGSGTTAKVAIELGRRAVSLDLAYHELAKKRTRQLQPQLSIA